MVKVASNPHRLEVRPFVDPYFGGKFMLENGCVHPVVVTIGEYIFHREANYLMNGIELSKDSVSLPELLSAYNFLKEAGEIDRLFYGNYGYGMTERHIYRIKLLNFVSEYKDNQQNIHLRNAANVFHRFALDMATVRLIDPYAYGSNGNDMLIESNDYVNHWHNAFKALNKDLISAMKSSNKAGFFPDVSMRVVEKLCQDSTTSSLTGLTALNTPAGKLTALNVKNLSLLVEEYNHEWAVSMYDWNDGIITKR